MIIPTIGAWRMTCWACPTQAEGRLADGRPFYFRFRHGYAFLGVAPIGEDPVMADRDGFPWAGRQISDDLDGVLGEDEARATAELLLAVALAECDGLT